jgi:predicted TIM-barrel fold metal-dependent hydrolase
LSLAAPAEDQRIIDIHQHTNYRRRTDDDLLAHQRTMGVTQTILLPAGSPVLRPSTYEGKAIGLAAEAGGNETVLAMARAHPKEFLFGANEVTDLPEARQEIENYLKLGAVLIGEQKFGVPCDSPASQVLYALAAEYRVPILMHFQEGTYNLGYDRLAAMLKAFPKTNFIGHAQTVWANIDKKYTLDQGHYPKGPVTAGGLTERYLADYPNFFADLSAGSGNNALTRDPDFTPGFLQRHQDKLLYGSDCNDTFGRGSQCTGAQTLATLRESASQPIVRKILFENSKRLFRLDQGPQR